LRREGCLCAEIPRLELSTRLVILMHWREPASTSNTGRLATLALPNSEIRLRGHALNPEPLAGLEVFPTRSLFLFPSDDARELTKEWAVSLKRPLTLFVPDGTWRQASKVWRREPLLASVPCVRLPVGKPSRYVLRRAPREGCLSTIEAIARAYGILEGPEVQRALEDLFEKMVQRTLSTRSGRSSQVHGMINISQ
jgi:DTW domain-containing protein YfiP